MRFKVNFGALIIYLVSVFSVAEEAYEKNMDASWWSDAVFYQIWVRSFYDTNSDGNGDLKGIEKKLSYIDSMGVDALWLSPIFSSPSYHGYDTTDFYQIDSIYGTDKDFDRLVKKANKKDIKIILDLAINHVSDQHPWFIKAENGEQAFVDYFVWRKELPKDFGKAWDSQPDPRAVWHWSEKRQAYYYGVFGGHQPDLNFENAKVQQKIFDIAEHWLNRGVDGFRLDAIRYLVETHGLEGQADTPETIEFWSNFSRHVKAINPNAYLVGEALTDIQTIGKYYQSGIDQAFEFDTGYLISGMFVDHGESVDINRFEKGSAINRAFLDIRKNIESVKNVPNDFFAGFLNNHDKDRFAYSDIKEAKLAAMLYLLSPGTKYIYYGEEIGMPQYKSGRDNFRRAPMQWNTKNNAGFSGSDNVWIDDPAWFPWIEDFKPWWDETWQTSKDATVASQGSDDSLLNFYRKLIEIKKSSPVFASPENIQFKESLGMVFVVEYQKGSETIIVVMNLDTNKTSTVEIPKRYWGSSENLVDDTQVEVESRMKLAPGNVLILKKLG